MNKKELIDALEARTGQTKSACEAVIDALPDVLLEEIRGGGSVTLPGFAKVEAKKRDARKVRNPRTGEMMDKPAQMAPAIKPAGPFKTAVSDMPVTT